MKKEEKNAEKRMPGGSNEEKDVEKRKIKGVEIKRRRERKESDKGV